MAETKTIYSKPLTVKQVRAIRDGYKAQNDYIATACNVLGAAAGAAVGGAIGAGGGAAFGSVIGNLLKEDTDYIDDLIVDLNDGVYSSLKTKTIMKYRNAGRNSGWYVSSVTVIGVK